MSGSAGRRPAPACAGIVVGPGLAAAPDQDPSVGQQGRWPVVRTWSVQVADAPEPSPQGRPRHGAGRRAWGQPTAGFAWPGTTAAIAMSRAVTPMVPDARRMATAGRTRLCCPELFRPLPAGPAWPHLPFGPGRSSLDKHRSRARTSRYTLSREDIRLCQYGEALCLTDRGDQRGGVVARAGYRLGKRAGRPTGRDTVPDHPCLVLSVRPLAEGDSCAARPLLAGPPKNRVSARASPSRQSLISSRDRVYREGPRLGIRVFIKRGPTEGECGHAGPTGSGQNPGAAQACAARGGHPSGIGDRGHGPAHGDGGSGAGPGGERPGPSTAPGSMARPPLRLRFWASANRLPRSARRGLLPRRTVYAWGRRRGRGHLDDPQRTLAQVCDRPDPDIHASCERMPAPGEHAMTVLDDGRVLSARFDGIQYIKRIPHGDAWLVVA